MKRRKFYRKNKSDLTKINSDKKIIHKEEKDFRSTRVTPEIPIYTRKIPPIRTRDPTTFGLDRSPKIKAEIREALSNPNNTAIYGTFSEKENKLVITLPNGYPSPYLDKEPNTDINLDNEEAIDKFLNIKNQLSQVNIGTTRATDRINLRDDDRARVTYFYHILRAFYTNPMEDGDKPFEIIQEYKNHPVYNIIEKTSNHLDITLNQLIDDFKNDTSIRTELGTQEETMDKVTPNATFSPYHGDDDRPLRITEEKPSPNMIEITHKIDEHFMNLLKELQFIIEGARNAMKFHDEELQTTSLELQPEKIKNYNIEFQMDLEKELASIIEKEREEPRVIFVPVVSEIPERRAVVGEVTPELVFSDIPTKEEPVDVVQLIQENVQRLERQKEIEPDRVEEAIDSLDVEHIPLKTVKETTPLAELPTKPVKRRKRRKVEPITFKRPVPVEKLEKQEKKITHRALSTIEKKIVQSASTPEEAEEKQREFDEALEKRKRELEAEAIRKAEARKKQSY